MDDYISREAAKVELEAGLRFHSYAGGTASKIIDKIPSADVRPVVRARWINEYEDVDDLDNFILCSRCKESQPALYDFNFCPNCGAQMDLEDEK